MVSRFYYKGKNENLFGISMSSPLYNEVKEQDWKLNIVEQIYAYQKPETGAAIFAPTQWREFIEWYNTNREINPLLPNSYTNIWDSRKMWKKYLQRFMYEKGKYLMYPHLQDSISLPIGKVDPDNEEIYPKSIKLKDGRLLKLLFKKGKMDFTSFIPAENQFITYNVYGDPVENISALLKDIDPYTFDKCTLILTVYDRYRTINERLEFYQHFEELKAIVIIWNNLEVEIPEDTQEFKIPVYFLKQTKNSLNNRFFPYPEIKTDCIVNMDDDWNMKVCSIPMLSTITSNMQSKYGEASSSITSSVITTKLDRMAWKKAAIFTSRGVEGEGQHRSCCPRVWFIIESTSIYIPIKSRSLQSSLLMRL